ncbi:unnamed protein product [Fraxinus pennsylvanica]|uniref:Peptidase M16 C-terminal domain-containing protein n=1 Tax=Fraxinus pennsylvanica TaxID=56036 RepID=A0AAD1ZWB4_9LAMI|nr:unnamed protein product [Fraxinus pennsylvanica]
MPFVILSCYLNCELLIFPEPLDILEGWVLKLFGGVKKGSLIKPDTCLDGPIWKTGKIYKLEADKDVHSLNLSWTLPSLQEYYPTKAEEYFSHLLGHEGKGGLFFLLKARGRASSFVASVAKDGMYCSSIAYIFQIDIRLTDSGLEKPQFCLESAELVGAVRSPKVSKT